MDVVILALLTAFIWGISPMFDKVGLKSIDPVIAVAIRSFTVSIILIIYLIVSGRIGELTAVSLKPVGYIIIGAVLASLLAQITYFFALKQGAASQVIPISSIYPLITVIIAASFLGEKFGIGKGVGAVLVVAGVILLR